jgi:hypothetical protein
LKSLSVFSRTSSGQVTSGRYFQGIIATFDLKVNAVVLTELSSAVERGAHGSIEDLDAATLVRAAQVAGRSLPSKIMPNIFSCKVLRRALRLRSREVNLRKAMKKLLQVIVLAVAWSTCGQGVSTNQALNVTGFGIGGSDSTISLMGWSFTPTSELWVIEMGFYTSFLSGQMPVSVGLWAKDTGALLKSVEVAAPSGEEVTYIPIDQISLTPFKVYYLGAYTANPLGINVSIMDNNPNGPFGGSFTVGPGIQVGGLATNNVFAAPVEYADLNGVVPAAANFRYRVPEPSSILLGCLAGFGWLAWRSRKK